MPSLEVIEVVRPPSKTAAEDAMDVDADRSTEKEVPATASMAPAAMEVESTSNDGSEAMQASTSTDAGASQNNEDDVQETTPQPRVTPLETPTSKKTQQKKVNQLTLSSFFRPFNGKKALSPKKTPPPPSRAANDKPSTAVSKPQPDKSKEAAKAKPLGNKDAPDKSSLPTKEKNDEPSEVSPADNGSEPIAVSVTKGTSDEEHTNATTDKETIDGSAAAPIVLEEKFNSSSGENEKTEPVPEVQEKEMSPERVELLSKYVMMMQQCEQRSKELKELAQEGIDEEDFKMPSLQITTSLPDEEFPDVVVNNMAILIEGSPLPLSELAAEISKKLKECHQKEWSDDAIQNKIKLVAERKPYLENAAALKNDVLAKYEDTAADRVWRWELGLIDVLPGTVLSKVKKARSARKKMLNHFNANRKLLKSLTDASVKLQDPKFDKVEATVSKIVKDEEKVLKFERDAEKQRMAQLARKKRMQEQKEKEKKKAEAEKKKLEKEREKQEAAEAREIEKQKKLDEKRRAEEQKKEKELKKEQSLNKQKACMFSFLKKPKETKSPPPKKPTSASNSDSSNDFDAQGFRSQINSKSTISGPLFPSLSKIARESRKRRTRLVPVSVTFIPETSGGFDELPFAEQKIINVPNKYRFLSFHEDERPPYHGTWSKRSKIVTGKTPFAQDPAFLKYDYDSEASWEEGDDEIGEDLDDDAQNLDEEEEDNVAKYDFEDGFCVADDQYMDTDEGVDEEARALYRKKLQRGDAGIEVNRICFICPNEMGTPATDSRLTDLVEGFEEAEAVDLHKSHEGKQICQDPIWLDPFAPDNIDDIDPPAEADKSAQAQSNNKDEYSVEDMRRLASFVHHNTLNSKDKLIEELRSAHPNVFDNRAKATRKLDSIGEKKKHPSGTGVYWEVSKDVLEELQLNDVLARKLEVQEETQPKKAVSNKRKAPASSEVAAETKVHVPMQRKKVKVVAPAPKPAGQQFPSEKKSPAKVNSPKTQAPASTPTIMNFLQPRKKPKKDQNVTSDK
eukprot:CAMPEP_0176025998 /NCGR_PEP_ID=MMETSP0120_2-20121206/12728_1 /TAXON_ID=160619 /ORGANISM="Kryptoperidinium foliaceum, Strain CCMP 1326" /LENGTH=1018 /DNA_ID=CAMNT_0017359189 /DNA_START=131 /DNA_END=3187 /DNA_ORIENTATION=-